MRRKAFVILASTVGVCLTSVLAQDTGGPTNLVKIQLKSGPVKIGEFLSENDQEVRWLSLESGDMETAPRSDLIAFDKNLTAEQAVARVGFPRFLAWQVKRSLGMTPTPGKILSWDPPEARVSLGAQERIRPGQLLLVTRLGEDVVDPETGKILGKDFKPITKLEVVNVGPSYCTARAASRGGEQPRIGDIVRAEGARRKVAVLPPGITMPANLEIEKRMRGWSQEVATRWSDILKQNGVPVVERSSLGDLKKEAALKGAEQELGRRLGVDALVTGTLLPREAKAQLRLVDVATGRVLFSVTEELDLPEFAALKKQFVREKLQSKLKKRP